MNRARAFTMMAFCNLRCVINIIIIQHTIYIWCAVSFGQNAPKGATTKNRAVDNINVALGCAHHIYVARIYI